MRLRVRGRRILGLEGARCKHGKEYARKEFHFPERTLTSTVRVKGGRLRLVPVRTSRPIAKGKMLRCMGLLARLEVKAPILRGEVLLKNIARSGADVIATRSVTRET